MTRQMDRQIVRSPISGKAPARLGDSNSQQILTRGRTLPATDVAPAIALGRQIDKWPDVIANGTTNTQRWSGRWSGDELVRSGLPSDRECRDQTGTLCPKFADARARQVLAERQLIEFNHRVANVLQMVASRVERHRRVQVDPVTQDLFGELLASVHASARLHRYLLPLREHVRTDVGSLLENLAAAIEGATGLLSVVEAESVDVSSQVAMHLAAAVNELAWNALKHAYRGVEGGVIRIVCRRDGDARLLLSVADEGCGLPADFDPRVSEGLGLLVVCATVRQFGGELRVDSDRGARFTLLLDLPRV